MPFYRERVVRVLSSTIREGGACKYCHRAIVWATVESQPHRPARNLPFSFRPPAIDVVYSSTTGQWETWPESALHRHSCPNFPKADPTSARLRRSSREGQGRML